MSASPAVAEEFGFYAITRNSAANALIIEEQLVVDVTAHVDGAFFSFRNEGPEASSITRIFFDDNEADRYLNVIESLELGSGVNFAIGGKKKNIPAGRRATPSFVATDYKRLSAQGLPPLAPDGVGPGEQLGMVISLAGGSFSELIDALEVGELRIGMHVQAFKDGRSAAAISGPPPIGSPPVPVPGAAALGAIGLFVMGIYSRRRMA